MSEEIKNSILKRLVAFQEGYRHNIGLIGAPGVGKSQLLQDLYLECSGRSEIIPVLVSIPSIDFEQLLDKWVLSLLRGVYASHSIHAPQDYASLFNAAEAVIPATLEKIKVLKKNSSKDRSSSLRELFALVRQLAGETQKKVILILDEFHQLAELSDLEPFGWIAKEIMMEKNILFLFASSDMPAARDIFHNKLALLFNNFETFEMKGWNARQLDQFLNHQIHASLIDPSVRYSLLELTQGRPLYLQILLKAYREKVSNPPIQSKFQSNFSESSPFEISAQAFAQVLSEEVLDQNGRISLLMEKKLLEYLHLVKESRLYVKFLSLMSGGIRKVSELAAASGNRIVDVKKMLIRMEQTAVIQRSGVFYFLSDPLFEFWIRESWTRRFSRSTFATNDFAGLEIAGAYLGLFKEHHPGSLEERFEAMLHRWHYDGVEYGQKRWYFPTFHEIQRIPCEGLSSLVFARSKNSRWAFQILQQRVEEKDVTSFLIALKQQPKSIQNKVLVVLNEIEHNARLLAQELKIQIWDRAQVNFFLRLYHQPMIYGHCEGEDESSLGALAQNIHTA